MLWPGVLVFSIFGLFALDQRSHFDRVSERSVNAEGVYQDL